MISPQEKVGPPSFLSEAEREEHRALMRDRVKDRADLRVPPGAIVLRTWNPDGGAWVEVWHRVTLAELNAWELREKGCHD